MAALQSKVVALEDSFAMLRTQLKPVVLVAYLGTAQTLTSGQTTIVALDKTTLDTDHAFDPVTHEYVVPVSGDYIITGNIGYSGMDRARVNSEIWIRKPNQSLIPQSAATIPGNASGTGSILVRVQSTTTVHLDQGDRVQLRAFHDYGASRDLYITEPRDTNLQIIRIPVAT